MKYSDFTINNLPEGKHEVVWYNNVNQFKNSSQDFFIYFVIRNIETGELKVIYRNIKEAPGISLGSFIDNKKVTEQVVGQEFACILNVPKHNSFTVIKTQDKSFYTNEDYFSFTDEKIIMNSKKSYKLLDRSSEQTLLEYRDINGTKILFPSYVIAQYYYFRTASMTKQVMASNIKNNSAIQGLYKEVSLDEQGNGKIILTSNAKGADAADIFRFTESKYANEMFHRIQQDLAKSTQRIKHIYKKMGIASSNNSGVLNAFFPHHGTMIIRFRGIRLSDGRILALEILAEDSNYPFQKLTIYRESKKSTDNPVKLGEIQETLETKISNIITNRTPSNIFTPKQMYSDPKEDGRLDLKDKEITHEILDSDEEEAEKQATSKVNYVTDVSFTESESSGDIETTHVEIDSDIYNKPDGWDEKERPGLEAFLTMLEEAQSKAKAKGLMFDYFVNDERMLPQKPTYDKGRKRWLKSLLIDNKTPRAYSCAYIQYDSKNVCVIDVERDIRIKGLSILVLAMNNNTPISEGLINNILLDFVQEKGAWLQDIHVQNFKTKNINHPDSINNTSIKSWAKRLLNVLKNI